MAFTSPIPAIAPTLQSFRPLDTGLEVVFEGIAKTHHFSWFWLRDHAEDATSLDPSTQQRLVNTFTLDANITASDVQLDEQTQQLQIRWTSQDDLITTHRVATLAQVLGLGRHRASLSHHYPPVLWDAEKPLNTLPSVAYEALMHSEEGLKDWLSNIAIYGFSLLQDAPPTKEATRAIAERTGLIRHTIFGDIWDLSAELQDHGDSAYSTQYLEPHTDSTYYHDAPGLQMFNCIAFDGKGGESTLVDGFAIAERIRRDDPEAYETLSRVEVPAQYLEPGVHLHAERPVLRHNADGELLQISFNNYDRAPFLLPEQEMKAFYRAYSLYHKHLINQDHWIKIPLRPGMTLIFDNWRTLHGRMGYVGKRVFCGCYHSRSEFESRLRCFAT